MRRSRFLLAAALAAALTLPASAQAGPAFPWWSTIDPRLVLCPAGDVAFHVIPRRLVTPVAGAMLSVVFCDASGWVFDAARQPAEILFFPGSPCAPYVYADASGLATLALKAGGTTTDSTVALYVDGVPFGRRFLSSPDQNGDLVVNAADEAILVSKLGTADLSADFDADGVVTEADRAFLRSHLGHAAELPTAAASETWGRLKIRYR
jgi:hypothetical protein